MTERNSLKGLTLAALFAALTAIGSLIVIPLQPVPLTLQTLFTLAGAALLGGRLAALSQFIYVLIGLMGLPVFAGGTSGIGVLLSPVGGYLIGFIAGAAVAGKLVEARTGPGLSWLIFSLLAGNLVIYVFGTAWLALAAHLPLTRAMAVGILPFLPGDLAKTVLAAMVALKVRRSLPGF